DAGLAFDPDTFRREYFVGTPFDEPYDERRPFSVRWSGAFAVSAPTALTVLTKASEPVTVTIDGGPPPRVAQPGSHTIVATFARELRRRSLRWVPPFRVAALGVIALWFAVGAVRTGSRWDTMEFFNRGDDWHTYLASAQVIAGGDIGNGNKLTGIGSLAYPYFL